MDTISGHWKVYRESGLVPYSLLRISVSGKKGWTKVGPVPIGRLRVTGSSFSHRVLPIQSQLVGREGMTWYGRLRVFGREVGTFRMEQTRAPAHPQGH